MAGDSREENQVLTNMWVEWLPAIGMAASFAADSRLLDSITR